MKNVLKVDSINKRLVMDRAFAKEAETVGSEAYMLLQNARRDYPTYTVVRRQIKRNSAKECYRGLTYEYMESYIASHGNASTHRAEYNELRLLAECHSIRYPTIKKWFLATYPEVAKFGMDHPQASETNNVFSDVAA